MDVSGGQSVYPLHRCKTIHLVRHAQGIHNVEGEKDHSAYLSRHLFDAHLTPLGWQQVDNLRKHVQTSGISKRVELVITSPLLRCMQTAVGVFGGEDSTDGTDVPPLMVTDAGESNHPAISSLNCPPFIAVEGCREHLGVHWCDKRRSISEYKPLFPAIDFSLIDLMMMFSDKLSNNITTIILSGNMLNGSIPSNFSVLPNLQRLSLNNNRLSGFVPTTIWENKTFSPGAKLRLNFQRNFLSDISGVLDPPPNVDIMLYGNPVCGNANERQITQFCKSRDGDEEYGRLNNSIPSCAAQLPCDVDFEHVPALMNDCFCAAPFGVGLRLRSPSISDFPPHYNDFEQWITKSVNLNDYQLQIDSVAWQNGPRLRFFLKFFPPRANDSGTNDFGKFNDSEIVRIANKFAFFNLTGNDIFGPYDLLNFTAMAYNSVLFPPLGGEGSRKNRGTVVGIVLGSIFAAAVLLMAIIFVLFKMRRRSHVSKDQPLPKFPMRIEGVKALGFKELEAATNSFSSTAEIGQGGYGKVYKGTLAEGTIVAIKRAQQGSLQGEKEFYTEIELLSRVHHRNLVSLVGYCNEGSEQMLVYEYMPNGSLHDLLSARYGERLSLGTRLYIALGAARGILYLHTEANPPIIHRDIKANNILLDSKFTAKVSDFGISKLAPLPDAETSGHVSTVVKGTPGYLDPEYFFTHKLTEKSDVYSLGIVFLELLTGMRPISQGRNIVREVNAACESGMMSSIIDKGIGPYSSDCVKKFLDLALRCSLDEQKDRPLMLEVVRELEDISYMLPAVFDNNIPPDTDVSTSGMSSSPPTSTYSRHTTTYTTMEGIELVSGVIPTIRPR